MFQHQIRFTLLAVLAAFMLALSGCGGGGSQTATVPPEPPMMCPEGQIGEYPDCMDSPETRIAAAQGRAETAATNARADADAAAMLAHQDDVDVATAVAAAEAAATAAEAARDAANDATDPAVAEALATQAETSEGHADTALGNAQTASTTASMRPTDADRIATAQGKVDTAATNARRDANAAKELDHQDDPDVATAVAAAEAAAGAAEHLKTAADAATDPAAAEALALQAEIAARNASTALGNAMTASGAAETAAVAKALKDATTKAANTKRDAITAESGETTDAGLGGSAVTATGNTEGAYNLAIKRDRDSTTVTITVEGATDADDEDFELAMDLGNGRTMHTRTMDADDDGNVMEETVIVSTDIEAPKAVEFAKFAAADGTTPQALDTSTDTTNDSPAVTNEALAVDETSADVRSLVMSTQFAPGAGDSTQHTFAFDDTGTADMDEAAEVAGTYNGAMGTYRCNGTSECTVTVDDKGAITAMSDGWVFTPDAGATSDEPDYDYLHYGFWLKKTTDSDEAVTYNEVETFAGSSIPATGNIAGTVTGTATYTGGAVGVYTHRTFDNDGTSDATSGHFEADANLTATFAQTAENDIAPNMLNTLRGTIENFDLSGGEAQGWSVSFSGAIDTGAGTAASAADSDTPFSATFHGSTDDGAGNNTVAPSSVVGEFNASFTNGNVAGAFGARKE